MKPSSIVAVVDRVEGASVVLEVDGKTERIVSKATLPHVTEGAVYRVGILANGEPDWPSATRDHAEEMRRRQSIAKRMDRLRAGDSGGDIDL